VHFYRNVVHSTLNCVSPAQYEQRWSQAQQSRGTDGLMESMVETMKPFLPLPTDVGNRLKRFDTSTATTTGI
jgi:hypothetical protein